MGVGIGLITHPQKKIVTETATNVPTIIGCIGRPESEEAGMITGGKSRDEATIRKMEFVSTKMKDDNTRTALYWTP